MDTLAQRLAEYAAGLEFSRLPPAVVHEVKRRVIDSIGCALGAWDAEPCVIARRVVSRYGAARGAALWGTTHRAPPDWAAFANGCLVRYLDFNDTYLSKEPAHPSDNIPPMLAVAEEIGATGRDLIVAIVLGYEIQCRLCDTASLRARGWDHVTYVAFSSALGAARLLRLDTEKTRQAVNIAGVSAGSLRQSRVGELSHWKAATVAHAGRRGVFAALLAGEGMTGPAPIFEGAMGFEKLVSQTPLEAVVLEQGDFMITKTSIKAWPAEYHSQSAITAALRLRPSIEDTEQIESIVVQSHDAAVDIIGSEPEKWRPQSRETADHSLPYIVAAALADGEITDRQFSSARFNDPKLIALVQRVKIERDVELSRRYPEAVANHVIVHLRDGRVLQEQVDYALGHARNPLDDAQLEAKFHALADRRLGAERASAVLQVVWNLDTLADVRTLAETLVLP
ncbi:2-methylcitrate dehydratase [Chthoniobacter flavus Ellin428]|uniref:2-methylcitrate dehydratase n=1 Tax=Chthoniobacter flavus Ellin428 TaxID=497964 RepID=B4D803_9BACT|nr:MmgE/PrpD family protein [Chthoniobacter flavus]EDY17357.1 2-methylcitrate dehydratase [Chthoniobacter flavus Ellin428]TCO87391.1 2-methylcitrate dehydratase [Chthoniobacter flavus]